MPWKPRFVLSLTLLALLIPSAALATVNHGDFLGTGVDFRDVSETTNSAGDPEPIWEAPSLAGTGTQLVFEPSSFLSSCNGFGPTSDVTESELTTTIEAQPGVHIEIVALQEAGDAALATFPPFGAPSTNVAALMSGTVTVIEDISGPIAPVVIPFSGTFTPSGTFALPTDFGSPTWTGNILVDVASVVPNATKVEFSLTNTLNSNCEAGANSTATIQKKDVSGPAVALMVNPLECELEVDKTCCVTQPVLPDLDVCEGDVIRLVMEYTGDKCHASSNDQGHAFHCWGHRKLGDPADITILKNASQVSASPATGLEIGDTVEFTSTTGTLFEKLKFKVKDDLDRRQILKIDTSCERALQCGDQFGAFKVVEIESTEGGLVDCSAPPPPPVCALPGDPPGIPCDAKLVDMVLEYNGQDCQEPLPNPQSGEAKCEGDATGATNVGVIYTGSFPSRQITSPASGINDGDRIRVTATVNNGLFPNQKFKIVDGGGVRQTVEFHVSCSKPLELGDEFGSFKLVEFTTKEGTHVALPVGDPGPFDACEVPLAPPGPHCTDDLEDITLVYIGNFLGLGCTTSNPQGGWAFCSGVADPGDPVSVTVPAVLEADPNDLIEFGDLVTISTSSGWPLQHFTDLTVTGAGGSQSIRIKTSCYKPLSLGDRFGSFVVFGMNRQNDGPISLGGNVQYQYTVTNPNASTVDNVEVSDDQLGIIATGESIGPSGVATFVKNATLYGTTTNVATVTGDVTGNICTPGSDSLTVNVLAPPPGSFSCSDPIKELTVKWGGAQHVLVKAWKGAPMASPLLAQFDDVAPGDAVEVDGFGSGYPIYEIFNVAGTVKLGESTFDLWCDDKEMNGVEDCGKNQGNTRYNHASKINDWLLEGMVDSNETLECTPGLVPNPPDCGIGPELFVLMPGLMWLHRRRLRKQA